MTTSEDQTPYWSNDPNSPTANEDWDGDGIPNATDTYDDGISSNGIAIGDDSTPEWTPVGAGS